MLSRRLKTKGRAALDRQKQRHIPIASAFSHILSRAARTRACGQVFSDIDEINRLMEYYLFQNAPAGRDRFADLLERPLPL